MSDTLNPNQPQPNARLAVGADHVSAAKLLQDEFGIDLLLHERQSGAQISFLATPAIGPIQSAAALVVHRDGTSFIHMPAGACSTSEVADLYKAIRNQAIQLKARVALVLLPTHLAVYETELIEHGFLHVSNVMTMESRDRGSVVNLGRLVESPIELDASDASDVRLTNLIQATYTDSLSDPSLGADHSAAGFLQRLKFESPDHQDRFIARVNGNDAAVCLLSRYNKPGQVVIRYLGVAPQYRGRKLGSRILAGSLASVWSPAYEHASVDVDQHNSYAVAIYEELGFGMTSQAAEYVLPLEP